MCERLCSRAECKRFRGMLTVAPPDIESNNLTRSSNTSCRRFVDRRAGWLAWELFPSLLCCLAIRSRRSRSCPYFRSAFALFIVTGITIVRVSENGLGVHPEAESRRLWNLSTSGTAGDDVSAPETVGAAGRAGGGGKEASPGSVWRSRSQGEKGQKRQREDDKEEHLGVSVFSEEVNASAINVIRRHASVESRHASLPTVCCLCLCLSVCVGA